MAAYYSLILFLYSSNNFFVSISALRIIVPTVSDCYKVLGSIHRVWRPLPGRIKDYVAFPTPNNYRGIHTTIFAGDGSIIEVQIRTQEMHKKTEYGMHFEYKETVGKPKPDFASIAWVKQFFPSWILGYKKNKEGREKNEQVEIPTWMKNLGEYNEKANGHKGLVDDLKADFFNDRVFVFTPKGDVIDLPVTSNPIDFAYAIHSDIGNHIAGAKVNSKLVSLETELKNGDIVEVITKQNAHPNRKWLLTAKTTMARKHIKLALGG